MSDVVEIALDRLGDEIICRRCGATGRTYDHDTCQAALEERCEGFDTVERAAYGSSRTNEPAS